MAGCVGVRKHPAPEGALRHLSDTLAHVVSLGQKAPSTRRCIKTILSLIEVLLLHVRKHPAPQGALRPPGSRAQLVDDDSGRRHPAPEGALRPEQVPVEIPFVRSESTQPQKAHEGIYRHVPGDRMPIFSLARQNLDILSSRASSRSRP